MKCYVCGNEENNKQHLAREMFFGSRTPFTYMECDKCSCIQLIDIPEDMSKYYPDFYYTAAMPQISSYEGWDKNEEGYVKKCLSQMEAEFLTIDSLDIDFLEVGCGNARIVRSLANMGIRKAVGIDAFLHEQHQYRSANCQVYRGLIDEIKETYDIILFQHSFEHLINQREVLHKVYQILNPNGSCFIIMPVASYAWHQYGTDWFQLDAPRHIYIHSFLSLKLLLEECHFIVEDFYTKSDITQFIRSDFYRQNLSIREQNALNWDEIFTPEQVKEFIDNTKSLDEMSLGDTIVVKIKK